MNVRLIDLSENTHLSSFLLTYQVAIGKVHDVILTNHIVKHERFYHSLI